MRTKSKCLKSNKIRSKNCKGSILTLPQGYCNVSVMSEISYILISSLGSNYKIKENPKNKLRIESLLFREYYRNLKQKMLIYL